MYMKVQTVEIGVDTRHTLALYYIQPCPIYASLHTHTSNVSLYLWRLSSSPGHRT